MLEKPLESAQMARSSKFASVPQSSEHCQESTFKNFWRRNFATQDLPLNKSHDPERYASERKLPNEVLQSRSTDSDTHYSLVDRVWHWTSFDWNRKCM